MKIFTIILLVIFLFVNFSCNSTQTKVVSSSTLTIKNAVTGKVIDIQFYKDGYSAKMKTKDNTIYFSMISFANLEDSKQYRQVKIGEIITVQGDHWNSQEKNRITVRKLLK